MFSYAGNSFQNKNIQRTLRTPTSDAFCKMMSAICITLFSFSANAFTVLANERDDSKESRKKQQQQQQQ